MSGAVITFISGGNLISHQIKFLTITSSEFTVVELMTSWQHVNVLLLDYILIHFIFHFYATLHCMIEMMRLSCGLTYKDSLHG